MDRISRMHPIRIQKPGRFGRVFYVNTYARFDNMSVAVDANFDISSFNIAYPVSYILQVYTCCINKKRGMVDPDNIAHSLTKLINLKVSGRLLLVFFFHF